MISRKTGTALSLSAFCAEFYGVTFGQFLKISVKSNFSKILRAFVVHYAKPN
jgi:glutathione peroxidase-family protein